ncbi:MAG TPA: type I polyketide synthase, partial [Chitinispirillaceae bacterium]|nr:type I polyketide synthase [Chitinispirillaceae bacterium]
MSSYNFDIESKIAIIGMACRFPGADNVDDYWNKLINKKESVTFFSPQELHPSVDPKLATDPLYVPARGICNNSDMFDASFFKIGALEASILDPQQRVFLETVWTGLEHAGQVPEHFDGLIGLYAGMGNNFYYLNNIYPNAEVHKNYGSFNAMIANEKDFIATRTSFKLNLKGPSISIHTACSTSLVSVCQAIDGLIGYQCDMAVAGGVSILVPQNSGYLYQPEMIFSKDGHCRPFDEGATGTVFGNGAGVVVLKRLKDALAAKDRIYAVLLGGAVNNDGSNKMSFMAPSFDGQVSVMENAQATAGVNPDDILFVETHGTATAIGDSIEIAALQEVFKNRDRNKAPCLLGSVKSNIGHLDAAAGIAGLIKSVLSVANRMVPPTINFVKPNPSLHLENSQFSVCTSCTPFNNDVVIRGGVSSFGIGGTNAHLIIEQPPSINRQYKKSSSPHLFCFSAKSEKVLNNLEESVSKWAIKKPDTDTVSSAWTFFSGRSHMEYRSAYTVNSVSELSNAIEQAKSKTGLKYKCRENVSPVFMFSGQGSPYIGMGYSLLNSLSELPPFIAYRNSFSECEKILLEHHGLNIRKLLYPDASVFGTPIVNTVDAQPAVFVISYCLARAWQEAGISPSVVLGHSVGEISALVIAKVLSLREAIDFIMKRAKTMQDQPQGAMISVQATEETVKTFLIDDTCISLNNAPDLTVVSGKVESIDTIEHECKKHGISCIRLSTSHAFHSPMMTGAISSVETAAKQLKPQSPQIPVISNVTGGFHTNETIGNPQYWVKHMLSPVRFTKCIASALQLQVPLFIEIGPGKTLVSLVRRNGVEESECIISMGDARNNDNDETTLLNAFGKAWCSGVRLSEKGLFGDLPAVRQQVPTYPFDRKKYWIEADTSLNELTKEIKSEQAIKEVSTDKNKEHTVVLQIEKILR